VEARTSVITYPYLPEGRVIEYVPADDPWMGFARQIARRESLDKTMPGASVITAPPGAAIDVGGSSVVLAHGHGEAIVGFGANGSAHHETHGCERVRRGCRSGEGYDLCEGCSPKNHSEAKAIADARRVGITDLRGYNLYLWGHWWCCKDCWDAMIAAGIARVFLLKGSEVLFNKDAPGNVVGRQFERFRLP
jgi:hypothetical protein